MIGSILVPATGTRADEATFAAAVDLARRFGAHLDCLHVRSDPSALATAAGDLGSGVATAELFQALEAAAAQREERAKQFFAAFCARERLTAGAGAGAGAAWHQEAGDEADRVVAYGRSADLIVIGRPSDEGGVGAGTLESALVESGRPLYVPGTAPMASETIAIAWKSTREAARAVSAADPFFAAAKRIDILTAAEDDRDDRESAGRLAVTLRRHGLAIEARHLPLDSRSAGERLLSAAGELDAGLVVMGGYGHSRLREWIFGGVTERVLRSAAMPVLIAH